MFMHFDDLHTVRTVYSKATKLVTDILCMLWVRNL